MKYSKSNQIMPIYKGNYKNTRYSYDSFTIQCQRTSFRINAEDARREWNGWIVHKDFYRPKSPFEDPIIVPPDSFGTFGQTGTSRAVLSQYSVDNPAVIVSVQNTPIIEDQDFSFALYTITDGDIAYSVSNDDVVATIVAADPRDYTLTYTADADMDTDIFALDSATGEISVVDRTLVTPDSTYTFTVTVSNSQSDSNDATATITLIGETISVSRTYNEYITFLAPSHWWKINEGTGTTVSDYGSATAVTWALGGTGTLAGTNILPANASDKTFDNPGGTNEMLTASNAIPWTAVTSFTISLWIKLDALPSAGQSFASFIEAGSPIGDNAAKIRVSVNTNGTLAFFLNDGTNSATRSTSANISINILYNIICTFSASSAMHIYVNGAVDDGTLTGTIPATINLDQSGRSDEKLEIGNGGVALNKTKGVDGKLTQFATWDASVLTTTQINYIYTKGITS